MSVTVRVALRVRPLNERECKEQENTVVTYNPQHPEQILLEPDRYFTFDYVYSPAVDQAGLYNSCIQPLFDQFTLGYNATILAYGQTGSGKTYSMGTSGNINDESKGILPRFSENLFEWIENQQNNQQQQQLENVKYSVKCSFLELYNEDINDLLISNRKSNIVIREDTNGNITWSGVHEEYIENSKDLLECLSRGSLSRTTASTDMNSTSSRSHAIFSVTLIQYISTVHTATNDTVHSITDQTIAKKIESKFHFVDLAGSERLKKTNAIGERAREGISINSGLLALGNVISALGDESHQQQHHQHIPYRNSKLTRLLQDSLGGNSQTLMLACISPAESNVNETLSTLKYANRAKNIKNAVVINQEQSAMDALKEENLRLKEEMKVNDAFMKEVHDELNDLRAKNLELQALLNGVPTTSMTAAVDTANTIPSSEQQPLPLHQTHHEQAHDNDKTDAAMLSMSTATTASGPDEQRTITPTVSLSTKRKRSNSPFVDETGKSTLQLSLEKQKIRLKKEYMFARKIKSDPQALTDSNLFLRIINILQLNIKEKKQLITFIEQQLEDKRDPSLMKGSKNPTATNLSQSNMAADTTGSNNKKKRLMNNVTSTNSAVTTRRGSSTTSVVARPGDKGTTDDIDTLTLQNRILANQLKQVNAAVRKAIAMTSNPATSLTQIRPILSRVSTSAPATSNNATTQSSRLAAIDASTKSAQDTAVDRKRINTSVNRKVKNIEDILVEIRKIVAFEHLKSHPICAEMVKTLKRQKIKLLHEQRDLLKERKEILKEFYKDEYQEQQKKQQYMDERIDIITVQVDVLTEHLRILSANAGSACTSGSSNRNNVRLINVLKPLRESDLRALILLMIQQDMVTFNLQSAIHQHTKQVLHQFQQGFIQLRRTSDNMNNQILTDILKSPVRCLSNGLVLISGK